MAVAACVLVLLAAFQIGIAWMLFCNRRTLRELKLVINHEWGSPLCKVVQEIDYDHWMWCRMTFRHPLRNHPELQSQFDELKRLHWSEWDVQQPFKYLT